MGVRDELRAAMHSLKELPSSEPLILVIPPVAFDKGEAWCREAYGVGPDVEIVEALPLPMPGTQMRAARRYPSARRARPCEE